MKVFLAIDIPDNIKQKIERQITSFKKDYLYMTWVMPDNFRITLYNFDEMENTNKIEKAIEEMIFEVKPFNLFGAGVDLFLTSKIVLYMHFYKEKMLEQLIKNIYQTFEGDVKKAPLPHIILGQYKIPSKQQYLLIRKKIQNLPIDINFSIPKISLYESITGGKKPVYEKLAEFTFQA